jgi:site-specific DNA-methyltransferase (adenine-specific)
MKQIPDKSIDCVICDLPYGSTRAQWDKCLPLDKLWEAYNRIVKDNGAIVLFGNEPFSSFVRMSNVSQYRYDWKWIKNRATGFANSNYRPMKRYEDIMVFSHSYASAGGKNNSMVYNPQGIVEVNKKKKNTKNRYGLIGNNNVNCGENNVLMSNSEYTQKYTNYPDNLLYFDCETKNVHPTQKPVALIEYLVKTYSNYGDTVLDSCMGSGTTGIACKNLNRNFIGIELEKSYFEIAQSRIESVCCTEKFNLENLIYEA